MSDGEEDGTVADETGVAAAPVEDVEGCEDEADVCSGECGDRGELVGCSM